MSINILTADQSRARWGWAVLVLLGACGVTAIAISPEAGLLALAGGGALMLLSLASEVLKGRIDKLLLLWVAIYPLARMLSFPRERAVVTPERAMLFLGVIGLMFVRPSALLPIPRSLARAGWACLAFIACAALSLHKAPEYYLNAVRYLLDGFLLPLCFAWAVLAWFNVRRWIPALHTGVCISSIICAAIAAAEIATGTDPFPASGSKLDMAGDIARPNGPFATNDQLALVGGATLFFLLFLRAALGDRISVSRRFLHSVGLAAAVGMTLTPMFRSVMFTLVVVLVIDTFWEHKASGKAWRVGLIAAFVAAVFVAKMMLPQVFEDRSGADNGYARVAQYKQNLAVFLDNPVLGVGFTNFNSYVTGESKYVMTYNGVESVDWPHSNLAMALTETGVAGFVPYVLMHFFLFSAVWGLRRTSASGRLVWKYFFYMFLIYWVTGMTESTGFTGEVNIWYAFAIAVCYKYAITEPYVPPVMEPQAEESAEPERQYVAAPTLTT